jgi:hypothetical protein
VCMYVYVCMYVCMHYSGGCRKEIISILCSLVGEVDKEK